MERFFLKPGVVAGRAGGIGPEFTEEDAVVDLVALSLHPIEEPFQADEFPLSRSGGSPSDPERARQTVFESGSGIFGRPSTGNRKGLHRRVNSMEQRVFALRFFVDPG